MVVVVLAWETVVVRTATSLVDSPPRACDAAFPTDGERKCHDVGLFENSIVSFYSVQGFT